MISDPLCEPNKLEYPPGSTPLHQIFEEYAADQNKWIHDFKGALEKMLNNGYEGLTLGPDQDQNILCNRVPKWGYMRYTNCYDTTEIQSNFFIYTVEAI